MGIPCLSCSWPHLESCSWGSSSVSWVTPQGYKPLRFISCVVPETHGLREKVWDVEIGFAEGMLPETLGNESEAFWLEVSPRYTCFAPQLPRTKASVRALVGDLPQCSLSDSTAWTSPSPTTGPYEHNSKPSKDSWSLCGLIPTPHEKRKLYS